MAYKSWQAMLVFRTAALLAAVAVSLSLNVRGDGGLFLSRRFNCYRGACREDVNSDWSWFLLHDPVDVLPRDVQNDDGPFQPLAEISPRFAITLFEPLHAIRCVFFKPNSPILALSRAQLHLNKVQF